MHTYTCTLTHISIWNVKSKVKYKSNYPLNTAYFNVTRNTLITIINVGGIHSSFKIPTLHLSAPPLPFIIPPPDSLP